MVPFNRVFKTNGTSGSWSNPFTHGADKALKIQWLSFSEVLLFVGSTHKPATYKNIFKNSERVNRHSICLRDSISENINNFLLVYF